MAISYLLGQLGARATELEDLAVASRRKTKDDLERDVKTARDSARAHAEVLRRSAKEHKGQISESWDKLQRSWNKNVASIRNEVDNRTAEHDVMTAQRNAEQADEDAAFAIDYAYAAIEEAEYAVLEAELARVAADDLADAAERRQVAFLNVRVIRRGPDVEVA